MKPVTQKIAWPVVIAIFVSWTSIAQLNATQLESEKLVSETVLEWVTDAYEYPQPRLEPLAALPTSGSTADQVWGDTAEVAIARPPFEPAIGRPQFEAISDSANVLPLREPAPAELTNASSNADVGVTKLGVGSEFGQTVTIKSKSCVEQIFVHPQDEIWIVSARDNFGFTRDLSRLKVAKLSCNQWQLAKLGQLTTAHQSDKSRQTLMFVHGNRTNYDWAVSRGMRVYRNLFSNHPARPPIRMVMFLWRSEREINRPIPDYKLKARQSVENGATFGAILDQFGDRDLLLVGYSLGAQVILAGLEHETQPAATGLYEMSFVAPTFDCDWMAARAVGQPAETKVRQANIFFSGRDRPVQIANGMCERSYPKLSLSFKDLTFTGRMPVARADFFDLTYESKLHSIVKYSQAPSLKAAMNRQLNDGCNGRKTRLVPSDR